MSATEFDVHDFDPTTATEAELRTVFAFENEIKRELWRDDPMEPFDEYLRELHNLMPSSEVHEWLATSVEGEVAGHSSLFIWHGETNQHIANLTVNVAASMRRQGIGRSLLRPAIETARSNGKTLLQAWTTAHSPAGDAFLRRIGAKRVAEESHSRLMLSELNHGLIHEWLDKASALADEFELGFWAGPYPEDEIETIVKLQELVDNSMPRDEAEQEDDVFTVERVRAWEEWMAKRRMERWSAYVRERSTGRFAGITEVMWQPSQGNLMHQWDTGVLHEFRNRGIGRWLKAAMIEKVQRDRPEVTEVRTGNSSTNASMLRINHEMGFKPYQTSYTWQIALDKVFDYLSSRDANR